jgi:NADH-quinone oxidoreductase subunit G
VPRPNPDVNKWWMCDRGRVDYAWINENRLVEPVIGGTESTVRDALDLLCDKLTALGGDFAVLLSPKLSNEDLLVLRKLFADVVPAKVLGAGSLEPEQPQDDILRRADPHPNSAGVQALGLAADARHIVLEAGTRGLLLFGGDPVRWDPALRAAIGRYELVVAAVTNLSATAEAVRDAGGILLPLATYAESAGSFTNFAGRVQAFEPALSPWGSALAAHQYGLEIANTLGKRFWESQRRPQDELALIWEQLLPPGTPWTPVAWRERTQDRVVPVAERTAQPRPRGYTPEEVAWRT